MSISLILFFVSFSVEAGELRLKMPSNENFVLTIPDDWQAYSVPTIPSQPYSGKITSSTPGQFTILVTAMLPAKQDMPIPNPESLRASVLATASDLAPRAVEQNIPVLELGASGVLGYYFIATDSAPAPGDYKYILQGQLAIKHLSVVFTVLMNGDSTKWTNEALKALRTARIQ